MSSAGLTVETIPYYDSQSRTIDFDGFIGEVKKLGPADTLLLHGACHNPTGADLSIEQWKVVADIAAERGFLPFIDTAYHGFAGGLDVDSEPVRIMAGAVDELLVSYSCSKNFGLYRERTGGLFVTTRQPALAKALATHMMSIARGNYSMPPAYGGAIVTTIMQSPELRTAWRDELEAMRLDVVGKRALLAKTAERHGVGNSLGFIPSQNGMFSLVPVSKAQATALREDHGIYMTLAGRVNICGFSADNVDKFCEAYKAVL